jgi:murein DD-endopeptidase MepM/ murein hydrolase activator NlpD
LLIIVAVAVAVATAMVLVKRYESGAPEISIKPFNTAVGASRDIQGLATDAKSGVRRLWVGLIKDGHEKVLLDKKFPSGGLMGTGATRQVPFTVELNPSALRLTDGEALLRVAVWDYSLRRMGKGNHSYQEKTVVIDTRPPEIEVLSRTHNVSQGGAGLVIYRLSEYCPGSTITVGEQTYPGYVVDPEDPTLHLAFFAVSDTQKKGTRVYIQTIDPAGNDAQRQLKVNIRKRRFRNDRINLSKRWLQSKVPDFAGEPGFDPEASLLDQYLYINRNIRQANYDQISGVTANSTDRLLWSGSFMRLPKSATRARFGDRRTYRYGKRNVDKQRHLGFDLASVSNAKVPAANSGTVSFSGDIGIYGKTVIIDHGFGVFSLYSHLSSISAQPGQEVNRGDIIGRTGTTGLAGGDHLHFSMLVHQTFVSPVEWWDAKWLRNNITGKLKKLPG